MTGLRNPLLKHTSKGFCEEASRRLANGETPVLDEGGTMLYGEDLSRGRGGISQKYRPFL